MSIPAAQIPELYKGLKQGDFLKVKLEKTETALKNAGNLIREQSAALENSRNLLDAKDLLISNNDEILNQEKQAASAREESLKADLQILDKQCIAENRRRFWKGVKTGIIGAAVVAAASILILQNN